MDLTEVELAAARAATERDGALRDERQLRRVRGIVHTPPALARFVVREVHACLQRDLGLKGGLVDPRVTLIDPACGPGGFFAAALAVTQGLPHAPARVLGYDVDPRALEDARGVLQRAASERGWPLELRELDTLREPGLLERMATASDVMVVIGNPPWAGASRQNPTPAMQDLLEDFRRDEDGVRLAERKLGVLSDAYVRFLRWSCQLVRTAPGGGALGLITNGSFIDGILHRGLRSALCRWFSQVHVVDLGGNALLSGGGPRDENVFGVRPSVAVTLAARGARTPLVRRVRYTRLGGTASDKLERLASSAPGELPFTEVTPTAPRFDFTPRRATPHGYEGWPSLAEAMPFHREGVQTNRDALVVDVDRQRLLERLHGIASGALDLSELRAPHFDPEQARNALALRLRDDPDGQLGVSVRAIAYRPLDLRWFAPVAPLCHRPRPKLLAAFDHEPLVLLSVRKDRGSAAWGHVSVASAVPDACHLSTRSSCRTRAFPLRGPRGEANLSAALLTELGARIGRSPTALEWVRYVLALLSSPLYRGRFDAELRRDYPRIALPADARGFAALCEIGGRLQHAMCTPLQPLEGAPPGPRGPAGSAFLVGHVDVAASFEAARPDASSALRAGWSRAIEARHRSCLAELPGLDSEVEQLLARAPA